MAQILDLGKLRFNWRGNYSDSVEYSYNDIVKDGPTVYAYKATTATTGTPVSNTTYWAVVSRGVEWLGTYTAGTTYNVNELVTDGVSTFIVTAPHTAATPAGSLPNAYTTLAALGQEGIPNQSGQTNKLLTTNGTDTSWTATTRLTKTYTGSAQGTGAENFETAAGLTDTMSVFSGSTTDFAQFSIVNVNNGANASTDFIAYTADGTNDTGWIDMGITSNNFSAATYGITGPHDGYIFMSGARGDEFEVNSRRTISGTATLTTSLPHGYSVGDQVRVYQVGTGYDGLVTVTAVGSVITFSYAVTRDPEAETALVEPAYTWKPDGNGNLVLATTENGKENRIVFAAGGLESGTEQMVIIPNEQVHIEIATESTSPTTGALRVAGGMGLTGNINTLGALDIEGTASVGDSSTVWANDTAELTNWVAAFRFDNDSEDASFAQVAFTNADPTSSTDIIAYMDNGDDSNGWMGMGITGSNFDDTTYGITNPGDGYIFMQTIDNTYTGNMVFATGGAGSENKLIFAAGGFDSGLTQMEITPGVNVHIEIPTPSTSPTTGALTVVGGVGITGDVNIAGNITFGGEGTQVGTANLAVEAPFIFTGDGSTSQTNDLGIVTEGKYVLAGLLPARKVVNKSLVDNVATLTTYVNHLFLVGDVVTVAGVDATFDGTYTITAKTDTTFSYAKTAGNVSSTTIGNQTFSINNKVLTSEVATLTTTATHPYLVGEEVVVTGVDSTFNGTYTITAVTSNTFSYAKPGEGNVSSTAVSPVGTAVVNQSASTAEVPNPVRTRFSAWSKDATDSVWKLASNIITKPETVVDYGQAGLVYDGIKVGSVDASSLTLSSTLTGGASSNIAINTNKFTVNASNGNTVIGGTASVGGTLNVTGLVTFTGGSTFSGTTDVQELREQLVEVTLSSNVGTFDWTQGNIYYIAVAPSANMTFNFTNVPTDTSKVMTVNVFTTQAATGRIPSALTINGSSQSIRWGYGVTPTPTSSAGKIDIFSFTFMRTSGGSWIVYGTSALNF